VRNDLVGPSNPLTFFTNKGNCFADSAGRAAARFSLVQVSWMGEQEPMTTSFVMTRATAS
jgi:hypothetical protein